ncbi:hypothetical protein [Deinococcus phoenicis]|uniref:hypothetical protein n=1 Tax=Deinococcus phoenicis TaxID=1476583 RepID=UPI00054F04C0|nr:hypothetical protein [Deinococcus phoenicis]
MTHAPVRCTPTPTPSVRLLAALLLAAALFGAADASSPNRQPPSHQPLNPQALHLSAPSVAPTLLAGDDDKDGLGSC